MLGVEVHIMVHVHNLMQFMAADLTKRERQAMDVIYATGDVSVSGLQALLVE